MKRVLSIACAVAFIACSKSTTGPGTAEVAGNWGGSMSDAILGPGTIGLVLTQNGDSVFGTWSTSFTNSAANLNGNLFGTVSGLTLAVMLKPADPTTCQFGPLDLKASVSGAAMSGKIVTTPCAVDDSATVVLARVASAAAAVAR
jgi:hypothetical protein